MNFFRILLIKKYVYLKGIKIEEYNKLDFDMLLMVTIKLAEKINNFCFY